MFLLLFVDGTSRQEAYDVDLMLQNLDEYQMRQFITSLSQNSTQRFIYGN
jgi:hypothetical protein